MSQSSKRRNSKTALSTWPMDVAFIKSPQYSKQLLREALASIKKYQEHNDALITISPGQPASAVRVTKIGDPSHPACGQRGLFASEKISPNTLIIFYLGYVHGPEDCNDHSDYDISLDRDLGLAIDAAKMGNEARFINDYRGTTHTGPNAEFRDCYVSAGQDRVEKRLGVFSLKAGKAGKHAKGIAKGEEMLVSYGKGFWQARES
ncbi:MAG: hypothetical protein M1831_001112 [Alyxoria varia]|nr:MAG: hypothetical protein M1831_001112 [Alyxoria varia]